MLIWVYLACAAANLALVIWGLRALRRRWSAALALIMLPLLFLPYDNLVIALGAWLGEGATLLALSWPRYLAHGLLAPLWLPAGLLLAARAGAGWATSRAAWLAALATTAALIAIGLYQELWLQQLAPVAQEGVLSYRNVGRAGPPIPAIVLTVALMVLGASVWRNTGWPWMFWGALYILLVAQLPQGGVAAAATNIGELLLATAMVATARRLEAAPRRASRFRTVITVPLR